MFYQQNSEFISPQESSYRVFPLHHFDPMVESSHFHLQSSLLEACSPSGADKAPAEVRGFVATLLKVSNYPTCMARVSNSSWNGGWRQSRCHNLWWSSIHFLGVKDQYVGIMSGDVYNSRGPPLEHFLESCLSAQVCLEAMESQGPQRKELGRFGLFKVWWKTWKKQQAFHDP